MLSKIELIALIEDEGAINAYFIEVSSKILISYKIDRISETTHLLRKLTTALMESGGFTPILIEWHNKRLVLQKEDNISRIAVDEEVLLLLAQYNRIPIFIPLSVLFEQGVQINKKIIEDILLY